MPNKGRGRAAKVVNFVAKWLNLYLSTVLNGLYLALKNNAMLAAWLHNCTAKMLPTAWLWEYYMYDLKVVVYLQKEHL